MANGQDDPVSSYLDRYKSSGGPDPVQSYISTYREPEDPVGSYLSRYGEDPSITERAGGLLRGAGQFAKQAYHGLGDVAVRTAREALNLPDLALRNMRQAPFMGERKEDPGPTIFGRAAEGLQEEYERQAAPTMPESTAGMVGRGAGNIVGEGAKYVIGGGAIRRVLGLRAAPEVARGAGMGDRVSRGVGEALKDAAALAPIDLAVTSLGPENSMAGAGAMMLEEGHPDIAAKLEGIARNPLTRFGFEAGTGLAGDILLRGALSAGGEAVARATDPLGMEQAVRGGLEEGAGQAMGAGPPAAAVDRAPVRYDDVGVRPEARVEEGGPARWYHGTSSEFDEFDPDFIGTNRMGSGGFAFTSRPGDAEFYARGGVGGTRKGRVVEAELDFRNPLEVRVEEDVDPTEWFDNARAELLTQMREGGHDGLIIRGSDEFGDLALAPGPSQIRQAGRLEGPEPPPPDFMAPEMEPTRARAATSIAEAQTGSPGSFRVFRAADDPEIPKRAYFAERRELAETMQRGSIREFQVNARNPFVLESEGSIEQLARFVVEDKPRFSLEEITNFIKEAGVTDPNILGMDILGALERRGYDAVVSRLGDTAVELVGESLERPFRGLGAEVVVIDPDIIRAPGVTGDLMAPPAGRMEAEGATTTGRLRGPHADLSDDELTALWQRYQRGGARTTQRAEESTIESAVRYVDDTGEAQAGLGGGNIGEDWRTNARGLQTQVEARIQGVEREMERRGLTPPESIYEGVGRTDVQGEFSAGGRLWNNKDLVGRTGENLRAMDEEGLAGEIRQTVEAWRRNRESGGLNERIALLYEEARNRAPNLLDEFGGVPSEVLATISRTAVGAAGGGLLGAQDDQPISGAIAGAGLLGGGPRAARVFREGMDERGALDLFGEGTDRVRQGDMLEGRGPQGMSEALNEARATVSSLEGKIQRGDASVEEARRYNDARSLLRRSEGRGLDADEVRARQEEPGEPDVETRDMFEGGDLPMDDATRMARAGEQGFDTDRVLYHGTISPTDFEGFQPWSHFGTTKAANAILDYKGSGGTPIADQRIIPVVIRGKYLEVKDGVGWRTKEVLAQARDRGVITQGEMDEALTRPREILPEGMTPEEQQLFAETAPGLMSQETKDRVAALLKSKGYHGVKYKNLIESPGETSYLVFDPKDVRSRFARFDPANVDSPELSGFTTPGVTRGIAAGGTGAATGAALDEENRLRGAAIGTAVGIGAERVGTRLFGRRAESLTPVEIRHLENPSVRQVVETVSDGSPPKVPDVETFADKVKGFGRWLRYKGIRTEVPMEHFEQAVTGPKTASTELRNELARARGWLPQAFSHLEERLKPVLQAVQEAPTLVNALLKAERGLELARFGKETSAEQLRTWRETVAELGGIAEVRTGAEQVREYYRNLLDMKLDAGVITREQYDAIVERGEFYIPFLPEDVAEFVPAGVGGGRYAPNRGTGVRRMSDALNEATTVDPVDQAVIDTYETFQRTAKQRVANVIGDLVERHPEEAAQFIERLPKRPERTEGRNIVEAIVDGERRYYEVSDRDLYESWSNFNKPMQSTLLKASNAMRRFMQAGVTGHPAFALVNGIRDFMVSGVQYSSRAIPSASRAAATGGAGAVVGGTLNQDDPLAGALTGAAVGLGGAGALHATEHLGRTLSALNDILGPELTAGLVGGIGGALSADEDESEFLRFLAGMGIGAAGGRGARLLGMGGDQAIYREFRREGGSGFGFYAKNMRQAKRMRQELMKEGVTPQDFINPRSWWDAIQYVSRAVETAPRLARYKHVRGRGGSVGDAVFEARDLSLDFSVKPGSRALQGLTKTVPFMNPAIQGMDKLVRLMKDPQTSAVAAGTILAPTIGLWMLNKDNPEYQNRPIYEKNTYWLIPKGGDEGGFFRVPKPFEIGFIYSSVPERALDYLYTKDPERLQFALQDMWGQYGPASVVSPPMPIGPLYEATRGEHGYDPFRRRTVNPYPWKEIPPEMQYDERTSTLGVQAGRLLGVSPAKVDYVVEGMTGTLGSAALEQSSRAARRLGLDDRPSPMARTRPVFSRMHTSPTQLTEPELAFRRKWQKSERAYNGLREIVQRGDIEDARAFAREHSEELARYEEMKTMAGVISDVWDVRSAIYDSEDMSDEEKRRRLAGINRRLASVLSDMQQGGGFSLPGGRSEARAAPPN